MTDPKSESEPREEDEELTLEKEKLRDLDVEEEQAADVKGGGANSRGCTTIGCT